MSKFDVHKWNRMRRLAEIDDRLYTGQSTERQEQALEDLANAIEELEMSGVFDDGNRMVEFMLNKAYNMLSKKANIDSNLKEAAFGDRKKAALENRLTGMAKAMVEDGDLFAEGGNVTYDEKDLKDGATPEQIKAIDQIKAAVIEMGGRVNYGEIDGDGILTYMYLVVDEAPTYDAVLKVITKESEGDNLFYDVFKSNK